MLRKLLLFILVFTLVFSSCEKVDPVKKWTVQYRVYKRSNEAISYRVTYRVQSGATKTIGPVSDFMWESEELVDFEGGSYQYLGIETISGKGELQLQILVNGSIYEEGTKGEYESKFEIESNL